MFLLCSVALHSMSMDVPLLPKCSVVIFGGISSSGKSTIAKAFSERFNKAVISLDSMKAKDGTALDDDTALEIFYKEILAKCKKPNCVFCDIAIASNEMYENICKELQKKPFLIWVEIPFKSIVPRVLRRNESKNKEENRLFTQPLEQYIAMHDVGENNSVEHISFQDVDQALNFAQETALELERQKYGRKIITIRDHKYFRDFPHFETERSFRPYQLKPTLSSNKKAALRASIQAVNQNFYFLRKNYYKKFFGFDEDIEDMESFRGRKNTENPLVHIVLTLSDQVNSLIVFNHYSKDENDINREINHTMEIISQELRRRHICDLRDIRSMQVGSATASPSAPLPN